MGVPIFSAVCGVFITKSAFSGFCDEDTPQFASGYLHFNKPALVYCINRDFALKFFLKK